MDNYKVVEIKRSVFADNNQRAGFDEERVRKINPCIGNSGTIGVSLKQMIHGTKEGCL